MARRKRTAKKNQPSYKNLMPMTAGEIMDADIPKREYLIAPWLRESESALIYAPTGVGKSMFTLTLTIAMAGGGSVMGWHCVKPRKVLYWDGEMAMEDIKDRLELLHQTVEGLDIEAYRKNLTIIARSNQNQTAIFPDLSEEEGRDCVRKCAVNGEFDLTVIDNLSTMASIENENEAGQFNEILNFLMVMKQHGRACVLVHHTNKAGSGPRGSSKLETTFEVMMKLTRTAGVMQGSGTAFTLEWEKTRGRFNHASTEMALNTSDDNVPVWEANLATSHVLDVFKALLESGEYTSYRQVAKKMGMDPGQLSRSKKKWVLQGLITEKDIQRCFEVAKSSVFDAEEGDDEDLGF